MDTAPAGCRPPNTLSPENNCQEHLVLVSFHLLLQVFATTHHSNLRKVSTTETALCSKSRRRARWSTVKLVQRAGVNSGSRKPADARASAKTAILPRFWCEPTEKRKIDDIAALRCWPRPRPASNENGSDQRQTTLTAKAAVVSSGGLATCSRLSRGPGPPSPCTPRNGPIQMLGYEYTF